MSDPKCIDDWACMMPGDCERAGHCLADNDPAPAPRAATPEDGPRELFIRTRNAHGWAKPEWEELAEETRQMYVEHCRRAPPETADARDALRYRWLRDTVFVVATDESSGGWFITERANSNGTGWLPSGEGEHPTIDAAIDAALAAEQEGKDV